MVFCFSLTIWFLSPFFHWKLYLKVSRMVAERNWHESFHFLVTEMLVVNENKTTSSTRGPWSCQSKGSDRFCSIHSVFERPVMPQGLNFEVQAPDFLKINDHCLKMISTCPQIWERFSSPGSWCISRFLYRELECKLIGPVKENETVNSSIDKANI